MCPLPISGIRSLGCPPAVRSRAQTAPVQIPVLEWTPSGYAAIRPINRRTGFACRGWGVAVMTGWSGPTPTFYAPNPISGFLVAADGGIEFAPARNVPGAGGAVQAWDGRPARCTGARPDWLAGVGRGAAATGFWQPLGASAGRKRFEEKNHHSLMS